MAIFLEHNLTYFILKCLIQEHHFFFLYSWCSCFDISFFYWTMTDDFRLCLICNVYKCIRKATVHIFALENNVMNLNQFYLWNSLYKCTGLQYKKVNVKCKKYWACTFYFKFGISTIGDFSVSKLILVLNKTKGYIIQFMKDGREFYFILFYLEITLVSCLFRIRLRYLISVFHFDFYIMV